MQCWGGDREDVGGSWEKLEFGGVKEYDQNILYNSLKELIKKEISGRKSERKKY